MTPERPTAYVVADGSFVLFGGGDAWAKTDAAAEVRR